MGNSVFLSVNKSDLISDSLSFSQPPQFSPWHNLPCIIHPHRAFIGQKIPLPTSIVTEMGLSIGNDTYSANEEIWLSMFYYAIQNECTDFNMVEEIFSLEHTDKQAALIGNVLNDVMSHLAENLLDHKTNLLTVIKNNSLPIEDHFLAYGEDQFSPELVFKSLDCDAYGSKDKFALRLNGYLGLSVVAIDCLIKAPAPLQRLGGLIVRTLAYMSLKLIGKDLVEYYNQYSELTELFDELTSLNMRELRDLACDDEDAERQAIELYFKTNIKANYLDYLDYIGDWDGFHSILFSYIDTKQHYSYLSYCQAVESDTGNAIEQINKDFLSLDCSNNPVVAHPLYSHFKKISQVLTEQYLPLKNGFYNNVLSSGSDLPIEEHFVVSLNTDIDHCELDQHNDSLCHNDEYGSVILNMNDDDLLPFLKNHTLSTLLLLAFDL